MKTKNEYSDWTEAVRLMENGDEYEDAVKGHANVVRRRRVRQKSTRFIETSEGQTKAIRRD